MPCWRTVNPMVSGSPARTSVGSSSRVMTAQPPARTGMAKARDSNNANPSAIRNFEDISTSRELNKNQLMDRRPAPPKAKEKEDSQSDRKNTDQDRQSWGTRCSRLSLGDRSNRFLLFRRCSRAGLNRQSGLKS